MEFKPSREFMEDIVKLASICDEDGTDSIDISFDIGDGMEAIIEMTFRIEKNGNV